MAINRILKTNFTGGEFSRAVQARVDLEAHAKGVKTAKNVFIHPHGGMSNRAGFELVSMTRQGGLSVQIPFLADVETDETYLLILSAGKIMFTRLGAPILETAVTTFTTTDVGGEANFNKVAHGYADADYVVFEDLTNATLHGRMFEVDYIDVDNFKLTDIPSAVNISFADVVGSAYEMKRRYTVDAPYTVEQLRRVTYAQDNDVMYLANGDHPFAKISRYADTNWVYEALDFSAQTATPINLAGTVRTGTGYDAAYADPVDYKVAAIDADTEAEGLPSTSITLTNDLNIQGAANNLTWDAVAGAGKYSVYKDSEGIFGYIGTTETNSFQDDNITEDVQDAPQEFINPFSTTDEYPRSVALHEQRLVAASLVADPQVVRLSKSTLLENFSTASPAKADDAISFRIKDRARQHIYNMVPLPEGLALFTSTSEWMVTGGNDDGFLSPTNPIPRPQSKRGSYWLPPLLVGDLVLFAQARGGVVREFEYNLEKNRFGGADRTIMARHMFDHKRIVSWCYAQSPYSIVWAVMDTGELYAFTFMPEHNVWGWTRMQTEGVFEDVETVPEDDDDVVYVTSKRTINGVDVRFHERMRPRRMATQADWFFVDCGLQYVGAATRYIYGLWHLEGEEVTILADGNVLQNQTVAGGFIDLTDTYENVVVGLPMYAEIETLDIDLGNIPDLGTVMGRTISIPTITLRVENSRGLSAGRDAAFLLEVRDRDTEDYGQAIEAYTGTHEIDVNVNIEEDASIIIQQNYPLPMTVTSAAADIMIGG